MIKSIEERFFEAVYIYNTPQKERRGYVVFGTRSQNRCALFISKFNSARAVYLFYSFNSA